ncbi:MAG: DUF1294 domain-containing protein [Erysipelotrichaceae bacterium]
MKYLFYYLTFINLSAFIVYGIDKYKSIHKKWRIKESTLLMFAFLMGSFGSLCAIGFWHHKSKHPKFIIINSLLSIVWIIVIYRIIAAG